MNTFESLSARMSVRVDTNNLTSTIRFFFSDTFSLSLTAEESLELCAFILRNHHGLVADTAETIQQYEINTAKMERAAKRGLDK